MRHRDELVVPIDAVERLARHDATGQLAWSRPDLEATVYLQTGRLAWAHSSASQFHFGREIARRAQIDATALREMVESSRQQRRTLGQTLMESGIALPVVREVLRLQIEEALRSLATVSATRTVFIARELTEPAYDDALTFSFDEIASGIRRVRRSITADFIKPATVPLKPSRGSEEMNLKDTLGRIMEIDGAIGCCAVDSNSGMMLGSAGGNSVNLEVAAAGNTEVVRAKRKTMKALGLQDAIDDILITLGKQYHLIRPLASNDALFVYLVLDKARGNLAMARHQLTAIERDLVL